MPWAMLLSFVEKIKFFINLVKRESQSTSWTVITGKH